MPVDATSFNFGTTGVSYISFRRGAGDQKLGEIVGTKGAVPVSPAGISHEFKIVKATTTKPPLKTSIEFLPAAGVPGAPFDGILYLENLSDSWLPGYARLVLPEGFSIDQDPIATFILEPSQTTQINWKVTPPSEMDAGQKLTWTMGAYSLPYTIAKADFTLSQLLIQNTSHKQGTDGTPTVCVDLTNPTAVDLDGALEACLLSTPDEQSEGDCTSEKIELQAGHSDTFCIPTHFNVTGDFNCRVEVQLGSMKDHVLVNVSTVTVSQ